MKDDRCRMTDDKNRILSDLCNLTSDICHPPSAICHPSRSGALTQPGQDLETGIAVGGSHADFSLEITHGALGVATDPAVAAVGVEAELGEAVLQFLHLRERHQPLASLE